MNKDLNTAFAALTDPTRRTIVQLLSERPRRAGELHEAFPISNPAISRHLRVLRESGVVEERRIPEDARVRLYALRPEPLREATAWLEEIGRAWQSALQSFKDYVEGGSET
jgi:DNA-binding transcriptional ArsR family regulator